MGGRAGGGARGGGGMAQRFAPLLQGIPDAKVRKEIERALVDYEKEFGIRQDLIAVVPLGGGTLGRTAQGSSGSRAIGLDKDTFTQNAASISAIVNKEIKSGWFVDTKKPIRQVLAHELGHATWSKFHKTPKAMAARKEVLSAYRKFMKGGGAKGWGGYSKTGYGEWFAEGVAKHMYGTKDAHTKAIAGIIKKYGL